MKRVLVIITNPQQASYRLRIDALRPALRELGFDLDAQIRPKGLFQRRRFLRSAATYDAVILQRKFLDPSDARLLRRAARKIYYDVDDALMFHPHPVGWFSRWRTKRRFEATAAIVDHVVAGNEYLAGMFRQRGRSVTVLPTCVDPARYRVKLHQAGGVVSLIWIGSHSTLPYLRRQLPAIEDAALRIPGIKLITIADERVEHAKLPLEHVFWTADDEAESLIRGDIGIAPTPDDPWTRGKCGFKIIQYMAAGLPVIASPVGANAEIVTPETGLLATTRQQWTDAIIRLASNINLRRSMGDAGRERVQKLYSLDRAVETWARLLSA
jgi:glycosyltransferase involved in cell wall biosynthesis